VQRFKNVIWGITLMFIICEKLSSIDGAINFLNRIGMNTISIVNFFVSLDKVTNFFIPFIVLFLCYYVFILKDKIIALKKFRDLEAIRVSNHYNAIIKSYQDAFDDINDKLKLWTDNNSQSPDNEKNEAEDRKHQINETLEYNQAFKDWGVGNYGESNSLKTFYKTSDYGK